MRFVLKLIFLASAIQKMRDARAALKEIKMQNPFDDSVFKSSVDLGRVLRSLEWQTLVADHGDSLGTRQVAALHATALRTVATDAFISAEGAVGPRDCN